MANLIDYVKWRGDIPFFVDKFNDIDALLLSQITYLNFDNLIEENFQKKITLKKLCEIFLKEKNFKARKDVGALINQKTFELFQLAAFSKRFENVFVTGFVNKIEQKSQEQFSACTFLITKTKKNPVVVFRGTDDTLIGWKEDFNMGFSKEVAAQKDSVEYINNVAKNFRGKIIIAGHSKGGNLAAYSGMFSNVLKKKKLEKIYNFDGPGFTSKICALNEYKSICNFTKSFYPEKSIVGMLFEHFPNFYILESSREGIFQHDGLSWQLEKNQFLQKKTLDKNSIQFNKSFNDWFNKLQPEKIQNVVDSIFKVLELTGAKTNSELILIIRENPHKLISLLTKVDKTVRVEVTEMIKLFIFSRFKVNLK